MAQSRTGRVKWFHERMGYGFIENEDGPDIFVHQSVIVQEGYRSLKEGEIVDYTLGKSHKGAFATSVQRKVDESAESELFLQFIEIERIKNKTKRSRIAELALAAHSLGKEHTERNLSSPTQKGS